MHEATTFLLARRSTFSSSGVCLYQPIGEQSEVAKYRHARPLKSLSSDEPSLAQAYRSAGQLEKGRAAAKEGEALLPNLEPGATKPRIRKLLELEAVGPR